MFYHLLPWVQARITPLHIIRIFLDAGLGAFSETFIKRFSVLLEFEGNNVFDCSHLPDTNLCWKIQISENYVKYLDASNVDSSNWGRWFNCPTTFAQFNVFALQCRRRLYFVARKDIYPGQELLVYYGRVFATRMRFCADEVDKMDEFGAVLSDEVRVWVNFLEGLA